MRQLNHETKGILMRYFSNNIINTAAGTGSPLPVNLSKPGSRWID